MTTASKAKYFMEDPREKQRLADKVEPVDWAQQYLKDLVQPGTEILDVGCGPAVIAAAVAGCFPESNITGLEQSDDRYAEATDNLADIANAKVIQGSATDMPFADHQYGLVYTRFMLEYLKDREKAIAEMVRVCQPGGQVMLQDLDGQLVWHYPLDDELSSKMDRIVNHLGNTGFDPYLGRKLFYLAKQAGLEDITVKCEPYHFYAGTIDDKNYQLWDLKVEIALPMIAQALGSQEAAETFKKQFMDYLLRDDTLTYSNVFTVVGTKQ